MEMRHIFRRIRLLYRIKGYWRPLLATAAGILLLLQMIFFTPSNLEEDLPPAQLTEQDLVPDLKESLPIEQVPDYKVEGFQFVSTEKGRRQWKILADQAFYFQKQGLVHTQKVRAEIYDEQGKITYLDSDQAIHHMESQNLELFGNVVVKFPEDFRTHSEYMNYDTEKRFVKIPTKYVVRGNNTPKKQNEGKLDFEARGLEYNSLTQEAQLLQDVLVTNVEYKPPREPETTRILSDRATMDRKNSVVRFYMNDVKSGPLPFVRISQPEMKCESRRAEFFYKKDARPALGKEQNRFSSMRAIQDVKIEEKQNITEEDLKNPRLRQRKLKQRYATAGLAEFDADTNRIILREFPQVYEDRDTITGETIVIHRDTDIVEVENSNAFTEGKNRDE